MAEVTDRRPPVGRPRTPGVDEAVLRATARRLVEDGYAGMSLAKVAADAGTTKPTVYLRWPTKQALVVAAIRFAFQQEAEPIPDSWHELPPKQRLLRALGTLQPKGQYDNRQLSAILMAESNRIPELLELVEDEIIEPRTRVIIDLLDDMKERGEIRADVDTEHAATMIYGVRFVDLLRRPPTPADRNQKSVELLWPALTAGL
jgi:AcrR family transcriptional regulator